MGGLADVGRRSGVVGRAFDAQSRPIGQFVIPVAHPGSGPTIAVLRDDTFVAAWPTCVETPVAGCDFFVQRFALTSSENCAGDCNGDEEVTVDDIVRAVGVVLFPYGDNDPRLHCLNKISCPAVDTNLDCQVDVTELVAAVDHALEGCR